MKKLTFIMFLLALVCEKNSIAQLNKYEHLTYDWEGNPRLTDVNLDTTNNSVIIFNRFYFEYAYEDNNLFEYKITHKRVKLLTHVGIDNNNKVYIALSDNDKVVSQKARVIKYDGSTRELKKDEFREAYDEESGKKYQYFAFEGIELGCEIELLYCIKRPSALNGSIIIIQSSIPVLTFEARYSTPSNLWLKFMSYNGCPDAVYDTVEKDKNVWNIKMENIHGLKEENSSAIKAELMQYIVKLDRNTSNGKKDLYSYGPIAADIFDRIYNKLDSKDEKVISKIIKDIKLVAGPEEAQIRMVENYIKTNYIYDEGLNSSISSLSSIHDNKVFDDFGAVKMYANIFKNMNIEVEIVLTCDRFDTKFDKNFECYVFLNNYLIYFPGIKKFLSPADNFTRLGFPNNEYVNNYGLFIKSVSMGDYNTGIGKIKFIQGAKYNESIDILKIKANVTTDFSNINFEIVREMNGYTASYYQPYFDFIKEEVKLKDFSENIIKYIDNEGIINDLTFENNSGNYLGQKPLIAKANIKSDHFIEKAGNKYLFKVGMLIGPQIELYKKDERKLPLEFPYNHGYLRIITFNIPKGYKVSNLDQLKISETYVRNNNDSTMTFISNYKLENNTVTITINEYYKEYSYSVAEFEEYRRVANAAANFNKVLLIFEVEKDSNHSSQK